MAPILGFEELKVGRFWLSLLCEIIGTAILINFVCGSCLEGHTSNLQISLTAGFTVATVVWCIAHVSGGCINPAVSVALFATRKMSLTRAVLYIISECIGGVLGATTLYITTPSNHEHPKNTTLNLLPTLATAQPRSDMSWSQVVAIEMIITFFLLFTVFATIDKRRPGIVSNDASAPIIIGLSVAAAHNWAGPLTGGVMNPAAIFGPAVLSGIWDKHWAYWIGELSGAVLAGLLYEFLLAANASKAKLRAFLTSYDYDDSQFDENGRLTELTANKLNDKHELATVEHK